MYSVKKIAKCFLCNIDRDARVSITHLKLQKLLYYAQAWNMVLSENEECLFQEKIEEWTHGLVVREIYDEYYINELVGVVYEQGFRNFSSC